MLVPIGPAVRLSANLLTSLSFFWNMGQISPSSRDGQKYSMRCRKAHRRCNSFFSPCPHPEKEIFQSSSLLRGGGGTGQPCQTAEAASCNRDWKSGGVWKVEYYMACAAVWREPGVPKGDHCTYWGSQRQRRRTKNNQGVKNKHALRTTWLRLRASRA